MRTGLDRWADEGFRALRGERVGLVCNQAAVTQGYRHIYDLLFERHRAGEFVLGAVFGPQHGLYGHTQDNMIEWESEGPTRTAIPHHSLYGLHRKPTPEMLRGLDRLVIDLQDVGARYYTFIWTMTLCLEACAELGIPVTILDRPNPIDGVTVEGTLLDPEFSSFVGLWPLPMRHGMTMGEVARLVNPRVEVVEVEDWDPALYGDEYALPWALPSPNMPTVATAVVYPGGCLLEATHLSEGRGSTRPFEIVGHPDLDGWRLAKDLNDYGLMGVVFQPIQFQPTFNKHAGQLCEGVFLHITNRREFSSILTTTALLLSTRPLLAEFWKGPPYEYEFVKPPIDILAGNTWYREAIDAGATLRSIRDRMNEETEAFLARRQSALIYPRAT